MNKSPLHAVTLVKRRAQDVYTTNGLKHYLFCIKQIKQVSETQTLLQ